MLQASVSNVGLSNGEQVAIFGFSFSAFVKKGSSNKKIERERERRKKNRVQKLLSDCKDSIKTKNKKEVFISKKTINQTHRIMFTCTCTFCLFSFCCVLFFVSSVSVLCYYFFFIYLLALFCWFGYDNGKSIVVVVNER